jgi:hypothetical protein
VLSAKNYNVLQMSANIFVSYSHQDKAVLQRVHVHLKPLVHEGKIDIWDDTRIKAGDEWKQEITTALEQCRVAILLVSADFLASDFIVNNELPPILQRAQDDGVKVLSIIVSPSAYEDHVILSRYQAINGPTDPISALDHNGREATYRALAQRVRELSLPHQPLGI